MTNGKEVVRAAARNAGDRKLLGYVVWWGLNQVHEHGSTAKAQWVAAGLDEKLAPKGLKPATAYSTAIRRALVRMGDSAERVSIKEVERTDAYWLHAIKRWEETVNGSGMAADVEATTQAKVALIFDDDEVRCDTPGDPIGENVQQLFEHHNGYVTANEASPSVTQSIRAMGGVPLRHNGGVYFVPIGSDAELAKLRNVVEGWGSSELYPLPQYDSDDTRRAVESSALSAFQGELQTVREEVESFVQRIDDDDAPDVQARTVSRRIEQLKDVRERAELYVEALDINREKLLAGVDDIEQLAKRLLDGLLG